MFNNNWDSAKSERNREVQMTLISLFKSQMLLFFVGISIGPIIVHAQSTTPENLSLPHETSSPLIPNGQISQRPSSASIYLPREKTEAPLPFSASGQSQEIKGEKVSIRQLQDKALQNHPALKVANSQIDAERGVRRQNILRDNPILHYEAEEIGEEGKAGKQGVVIEQELGNRKRREMLAQQSDRTLEALDWNRQIVTRKIQNDVRALAYRTLIVQKKVDFQRQLVSISEAAENRAREALNSGSVEITKLNFIQLQNQTRQAKLSLEQNLNDKEALEKKLAIMIGAPNEPIGEISDDPAALGNSPMIDYEATLNNLLEYSPEIAKKRAEINEKRAALAYEETPQRSFSVSGGALYDFSNKTTVAKAGIGVPIRINDRNEGNILRAKAEFTKAQSELEQIQLKLRSNFTDVFAVYKSAKAEVQTYQGEILPDLERFFTLSQQAYQQGQINFLEITSARAIYIESSVNYLDSLERLSDSIVKIEGSLLEQCLEKQE